jgi:hypothetical protein
MSVFPAAYSQQSNEPDGLIKQLKFLNETLIKQLQASKDSIRRLDSLNKVTILSLNKKNGNVEPDKTESTNQKKKSDKDIIKDLKASNQKNTDLITLLNDSIKKKDSLIIVTKNKSILTEQEKFKEGQQFVYDKIGKIYQNSTLDSLIKYSTKQSVERDSQLVINNAEAVKKWQALQIYFAAQQILKEKYDDQKLKNAQMQLASVTQKSELLDELKKKLPKYKLYSDSLKTTIGRIINYDQRFDANNEDLQKAKQQHILLELSSYFHNYRFNYTDYPYLADIVLDIMKRKQKDANTDISKLLTEL